MPRPALHKRFEPAAVKTVRTNCVCTFLSAARADRQHCAGRGVPLPYNAQLAA